MFFMLAAMFSAGQDVVNHKAQQSIFNEPGKSSEIFGFTWIEWFNIDGKSWLNKYNGRDVSKGKRTTRILFFNIHIVQVYDAWHFFKSSMILFAILSCAASGRLAVFVQKKYTPKTAAWFWLIGLLIGVQIAAWVLSFNLFYDRLLIA